MTALTASAASLYDALPTAGEFLEGATVLGVALLMTISLNLLF
ncbi:MAG TPA: hypothetical protein VED40_13375 [Azospirillaceae bacterium]|nr:hypothetical protein [Azospirillaceae bacterium]